MMVKLMKITDSMWNRMRDVVVEQNDIDIAVMFRERNTQEIAHLSDEQLQTSIKEAREAAFSFGITDRGLRMRFIMLGVFRLPRFWQDPTIAKMLNAPTGTPDIRFGDVCAMFKMSADRADKPAGVWW
ncbi:MAG: hypothetical protein AAFO75_09395, partial [Pseudomonadota bacterium]